VSAAPGPFTKVSSVVVVYAKVKFETMSDRPAHRVVAVPPRTPQSMNSVPAVAAIDKPAVSVLT
jgi:hypothetical protein